MEKETLEVGDMTVYEVSFLLLPSLAEEQVPREVASIKEAITSRGGQVLSFEDPVLIDLAYPMTKVTPTSRVKVESGHFGWVKFEIDSSEVEKIKKDLDINKNIIRNLMVKTVKENTLLNGKMNLQKEEKVRKDEEVVIDSPEIAEEVKAVSTEEIDKSIDELVVS